MQTVDIKIAGMTCGHCVQRVKKVLTGLAGVAELHVDIGSARVRYDEGLISAEKIEHAIEEAGYTIVR